MGFPGSVKISKRNEVRLTQKYCHSVFIDHLSCLEGTLPERRNPISTALQGLKQVAFRCQISRQPRLFIHSCKKKNVLG